MTVMKKPMIFDLQRCSLVDGPGVRTTVFFKGCNLRCKWCHNPESQSACRQILFHRNKCTGCGKCREVCPNALENCDFCGRCADFCPNDARELCGREWSVQEILSEIRKDKAYYAETGGVTFSGGECMLQIEALTELLMRCKDEGIHTAVDTAGAVDWARFEQVLPYTDLFLFDMKCRDAEIHRQYTGISNALILENLRKLALIAPDRIIIRIPVIPGVNDSEREMRGMADFLSECGLKRVELLPYHKMGEHKYDDLGMEIERFDVPSEAEMERCRAFFE